MEEANKESYRTFLNTSRDVNEDMINYWAEKIILKTLEINKMLMIILLML